MALGLSQTLGYASSQYLPAVLAAPMAHELGWPPSTVFALFSGSLVVSALVGPWAGRHIDQHGGRGLLTATSLVFALGLLLMSQARSLGALALAWALMGLGMGAGLYEAAFASLVRWQGSLARRSMTHITLMAGMASTLGWPLSAWMEAQGGWRLACLVWAGLHLVLGAPLHACLPRMRVMATTAKLQTQATASSPAAPRASGLLLAWVFAATSFVATAMAAHLPGLLQACGASAGLALTAAALLGPAQVLARLLEWRLLQRWHPLVAARLAVMMHPLGALPLLLWGGPWALGFAVLHGAGNGILTIARGALPLALFGPQGYGRRQGLLMLPARVTQAAAPWVFGLALERLGAGVLAITATLGLLSLLALGALGGGPATGRITDNTVP